LNIHISLINIVEKRERNSYIAKIEKCDNFYRKICCFQEEPKSFLSLDTEGRVIRLDSFSKVISSGIRLGFVTAAAPLIASIELHLQSSHLHAPTLSQVGGTVLTLRGNASLHSSSFPFADKQNA